MSCAVCAQQQSHGRRSAVAETKFISFSNNSISYWGYAMVLCFFKFILIDSLSQKHDLWKCVLVSVHPYLLLFMFCPPARQDFIWMSSFWQALNFLSDKRKMCVLWQLLVFCCWFVVPPDEGWNFSWEIPTVWRSVWPSWARVMRSWAWRDKMYSFSLSVRSVLSIIH